jgi:two-component system OmpR family sensor kinase
MRQPRGIRSRLLIVVVLAVALALTLMTLGFNVLLARSLSRDADALLRSRAATEAASVDVVKDRVVTPDQPDTGGLESQAWVFRSGRALERPNVSAELDRAAQAAAATPGVSVEVASLDTRLYAMAASDDPATVVVAGVSLAPYEHTQQIALVGSLILALALLLVVTLVARWMLRAALRPVASMTADVQSWSEHDPERRFAAGVPYDEISQLAATLDGLLDRLSASLRREQRFSAEMSHELRTPLAKAQAEAELALRRPRQPDEYRAALETIVRNTRQMGVTVEMLVAASQQESGLARGRCDARLVLEQAAEAASGRAAERGLRLVVKPPPAPLTIGVDVDVATRVLGPLLDNACRFARAEVRLSAVSDGASVGLLVVDDGPGVAADEIERIFEPGVRGSAASAREATGVGTAGQAADGAGLGLALARRLARAGGGDVLATAADGGRFTARLPAG